MARRAMLSRAAITSSIGGNRWGCEARSPLAAPGMFNADRSSDDCAFAATYWRLFSIVERNMVNLPFTHLIRRSRNQLPTRYDFILPHCCLTSSKPSIHIRLTFAAPARIETQLPAPACRARGTRPHRRRSASRLALGTGHPVSSLPTRYGISGAKPAGAARP
jgi:hypothetical protein